MRILYIDIDTLRPDHMGCYGYSRNTTPNLDTVAADGMVFEKYYCPDAPCLPSRAALLSGQFGIHTGIVGHGGTAADKRLTGPSRDFADQADTQNLNYIFNKAGLYTASISTFPERHSAWWFNAGFNEMHNMGKRGMESGEEVLPIALDWLKRNKERGDWYLHLHLWDPHTPYRAPAEFGDPFEDKPLDNWITEEIFEKHKKKAGPHSIMDLNGLNGDDGSPRAYPRYPGSITDYNKLKNFFDGYDTGILYADTLLGEVIALLKEQGVYDDMAIIISSDHGENMGELGLYGEHGTADDITCRIPMIIKWPGGAKGRDTGFRYNLDLAPTMAELLGVKPSSAWDGKSYANVINGKNDPGRPNLVLSQQAHVCQRAARFGDYIYIRTIRDGFQLFDDEMLFNVKDDPHEQFDIKDKHPDICAQGAKIILDWQESMLKSSDSPIDPMWTVYHEGGPLHAHDDSLEYYLNRLETSGRGEAAAKLKQKYKSTIKP